MNTENNKLIAEFMELTIITDGISFFDTNYKTLKNYDTDWNWLMEVVVECFNKGGDTSDDINFKLNDALLETNIESLYKVVVESINWHNNQNKR